MSRLKYKVDDVVVLNNAPVNLAIDETGRLGLIVEVNAGEKYPYNVKVYPGGSDAYTAKEFDKIGEL